MLYIHEGRAQNNYVNSNVFYEDRLSTRTATNHTVRTRLRRKCRHLLAMYVSHITRTPSKLTRNSSNGGTIVTEAVFYVYMDDLIRKHNNVAVDLVY